MADLPDLAETIANLRREVGPTHGVNGDSDGGWQPMVAACELWVLLDALESPARRVGIIPDSGPPRPPHPKTMAGRGPATASPDPLGETHG